MASELNVLAHMLNRISESNRQSRDFTLDSLRDVITEVVACFPVYRTYVDEQRLDRRGSRRRRARDRPSAAPQPGDGIVAVRFLSRGGAAARSGGRSPSRRPQERRGGYPPADASEARERLAFAMKFQQYTGPVQAKGLEDTAFYRYNLLLSLNEVGGDPSRFGRTVAEFHEANQERAARLAVRDDRHGHARHQARRGRARAHQRAVGDPRRVGARGGADGCGSTARSARSSTASPAPDRNDEYRFYQALLGVWPADARRADRGAASWSSGSRPT